jgi:hypothetical protein
MPGMIAATSDGPPKRKSKIAIENATTGGP